MAQPTKYEPIPAEEEATLLFGLRALATVLPQDHPRRLDAARMEASLVDGRLWLYKAVPPEDKSDDRS